MVKGQVKIQQTAFMLIAITIFFVLVGLFAAKFSFAGLDERATELKAQEAEFLVSSLANSPEFSCGDAFGGTKTNCIDSDKVMIVKKNIEIYKDFWEAENIEIRRIYPPMEETICTLENYPNCNVIRVLSDKIMGPNIKSFVTLCKKETLEGRTYNKCELAEMSVSYKDSQ